MGTYYESQGLGQENAGDVIRRAELYSAGEYNATGLQRAQSTHNQYSLYWQITSQHQFEWSYTHWENYRDGVRFDRIMENGDYLTEDSIRKTWNVAYRGIIGTSGILEASFNRMQFDSLHGTRFSGERPFPIRTYTIGSYRPRTDGGGDETYGDWSRYWMNGYIGANMGQSTSLPLQDESYRGRIRGNNGLSSITANGNINDMGNWGFTDNVVLNYQHHLSTVLGTHLIDLGFNNTKSGFKSMASGTDMTFNTVGHISRSLTDADVWNATGTKAPASVYRDKYIVFNVAQARYSHVDPWAVNYYGLVDEQIYNAANGLFANAFSGANSVGVYNTDTFAGPGITLPYMYFRYGDGDGNEQSRMTSFYINDLWSINDNHSIMLGLRMDQFKVANSVNTDLHSYNQPTVRLEYKWDIGGDNKRLVNVSWGQFHSYVGMGPFDIFNVPAGNTRDVRYWNTGSPYPYLVTKEELMNQSNYGLVTQTRRTEGALTNRVDPDWRSPLSTEMSAGYTRNLGIGGFWKATVVYRTWTNLWDYFPGDVMFDPISNQQTYELVLKNDSSFERRYAGVELEWNVPIAKRLMFLGSYTYARFLTNSFMPGGTSSNLDSQAWWVMSRGGNWSAHYDNYFGSRAAWQPTRLMQAENYLKFFLLTDISTGKVASNLTFEFQYTTATPQMDYYYYYTGYPSALYPQLVSDPAGTPVAGTSGRTGLPTGTYVNYNWYATQQDGWELFFRYLINVPIARNFVWQTTIQITNPFNHRGLTGRFGRGDANMAIYANIPELYGANAGKDLSRGVFRSQGSFGAEEYGRQGGRSVSLNSAIKF
jgi:hypothetical protein